MTDLASWLLSDDGPIAEDERNARDEPEDGDIAAQHTRTCGYGQGELLLPCLCDGPARVLSECAAKRRILEVMERCDPPAEHGSHLYGLRLAVRLMAQVYAGRPGWNEEWSA